MGLQGREARGTGLAILAVMLVALTACTSMPSSGDAPPIQTAGLSALPASDTITSLRQTCEPAGSKPKPVDEILDCYTRHLHEVLQTHGPAIGMLTLYQLASASPIFANVCHVTAHHLGDSMYSRVGNPSEAMALCQEGCAFACQHAVLNAHLRELPPGALPDLERLCPLDSQQQYSLRHSHCTHGLGHGFAHYFKDVPKALSACAGFRLSWERGFCTRGVFMEHALGIVTTQAPRSNPIQYLDTCSAVEPLQRNNCYYYLISLVSWATGWSVPATFAACETVPVPNRPGCYRGVGRAIGAEYLEREEDLMRVCRSGQEAYAADCMLGFAGILANFKSFDQGFRFCAKLPDEPRAQCAEYIGLAIRLRWDAKERISAECQKAGESRYIQACLNASFYAWEP